MRVLSVLFTIGVLLSQSVYAQSDPRPFLTPSDILQEQVQVIETLPVLSFDIKQTQALYYRTPEADHWQIIPLPENFIADFYSQPRLLQRADGTYLIGKTYPEFLEQQTPAEVWVFDPTTSTLSHPSGQCGIVQALPGTGQWQLTEEAGGWRFCHTETGQTSPLINKTFDQVFCPVEGFPAITPDGQHVVDVICEQNPESEYITDTYLYRYTPVDNTVQEIGAVSIESRRTLHVETWADPHHLVLAVQSNDAAYNNRFDRYPVESTGIPARRLLLADVTIADGITQITEQQFIWSIDNHYYWLDETCAIHEFDLATLSQRDYPHPVTGACDLGVSIPDSSGDRLVSGAAGLTRFNLEAQDIKQIYEGEMGSPVSISPNGRYVELAIGDVHAVPQQNGIAGYSTVENTATLPHLQILDLTIGETILKSPYYISDPMVAPLLAPILDWTGANSFSLRGGTVYEWDGYQINADGSLEALCQGQDCYEDHAAMLLKPDLPYQTTVQKLDDGTFRIEIWMWEDQQRFTLGEWIVKGQG